MKSNENYRFKKFQTLQTLKKKQLYNRTPIQESRSASSCKENGDHLTTSEDFDRLSNISSNENSKKIIIIKLPSYIINSHPLTNIPENDISMRYNIQLKSPENENLYATNHYVLLKVMTQYVYYRKLCSWIKEELRKKRLELLEFARNALITARGSNIFNVENMPDSELTSEERDFLCKYADESTIEIFSQPNLYVTSPQNDSHSKFHDECPQPSKKPDHEHSIKTKPLVTEHKDKYHHKECLDGNKEGKKVKACEKDNGMINPKDKADNDHEEGEVYVCDKCSGLKSGKYDKKHDKSGTFIQANTCTCKTRQTARCCVVL